MISIQRVGIYQIGAYGETPCLNHGIINAVRWTRNYGFSHKLLNQSKSFRITYYTRTHVSGTKIVTE